MRFRAPSSAPDATSDPVPLTGQTGALTVTTANTVVNQYGVVGANVAAGATTLTITSAADFTATAPFTTALAAGDLLMICADVVAGATVTEAFPAALTGVTWTCVASGGSSCSASGSGNLGTPVTVAPGGTVTFTITGTVDRTATGTLAVTAIVAAPPGVTDPTPGNNAASDTDQICRSGARRRS